MNRALLRRGSTPESSRALGRFELEQMESSHEELLDLLPDHTGIYTSSVYTYRSYGIYTYMNLYIYTTYDIPVHMVQVTVRVYHSSTSNNPYIVINSYFSLPPKGQGRPS